MAEFNSVLLVMKINIELSCFFNRVIVLTNAVQQFHHRRLAVDLWSPAQMSAVHESVIDAAQQDGFHPVKTQILGYYQIEVSLNWSNYNTIIFVQVPCIK